MADTTTQTMTAEQFFEWTARPENQGKCWELDRGEVIEMPPPGDVHGTVQTWLSYLFWEFAKKRGRGRVTSEAGLIVEREPDSVRGPDLMFMDESRRLDEVSPKVTEDMPVLIVEIRSPSDRWSDMQHRIGQYQRLGVPLVWVVEPEDGTVTVFQPNQPQYVVRKDEELTGGDILPDFRCRVSELFTLPGRS